ncbi:MAG: methyltransferase domain-containing protein [Thermoanaerobaculia bacterium]
MVDGPLRAELMDSPELPAHEAERALEDIGRTHRVAGHGALLRALLPRLGTGRRLVLDVGTGRGEVSSRLVEVAHRRGAAVRAVGLDRQLRHLLVGRRHGFDQMRVVADARALPFADGSVDWAFSTLFFHHFAAAANRLILDEMRRVARAGAVVADLRRSRLGVWLTRSVLRLLPVGEVARHDGRVSAEQAWGLDEVRGLVDADELVELERRWPFRFSLVLEPGPPGRGQTPPLHGGDRPEDPRPG